MDRRKSRLEAVSASDPALDRLTPPLPVLRRLPLKLQAGLALACLALGYGAVASLRGDLPLMLGLEVGGGLAAFALAVTGTVLIADHFAARRRVSKRRTVI